MIDVNVIGTQSVELKLGEDMRKYLEAIRSGVRKVGYGNEAVIKTEKLSGQVLHRRSGRLSAGVHTNFHDDEQSFSAVTGIGPELGYGKMHEMGGVFTVKQHMRTITQAFGRPIQPKQVSVKEYMMRVTKRSFLLSTLQERRAINVGIVESEVKAVQL